MKYLARINSNRKYRAADLIEYMLYSSGLDEYLDDDFLKEWIPAESRMGFIKANNLDVYGVLLIIIFTLIGIAFKLIKYITNSSSSLNEGVNEEFLKECVWIPADFRMGIY
ncbi:hypothetical protein RhiirA4_538694 [Rhizophagus irregularis]|uniref:Uncharacterized protein n=1 Tax=Rhizophagus irregularis TaxID=588596 RepID=A0A2I1G0W6_9GLOM|nr:hypothetical protein RhiirA4_538694 [Rhizophagus irregularis]